MQPLAGKVVVIDAPVFNGRTTEALTAYPVGS
jgi:hypothetical protein